WVTLHAGHVRVVVVDAMTVESERRIAQQKHRVGLDRTPPFGVLRHGIVARRCGADTRRLAVDEVLLLGDGYALRVRDLVRQLDEDEPAGASLLFRHIVDARKLRSRYADRQ